MADFAPGDRLKSIASGIIYVYPLENPVRPAEIPSTHVPVRQELWGPSAFVWMDKKNFAKVDSEHPDAAKDKYGSAGD